MFRLILVGIIVSLYFILSIITLPLAWLIGLVINKRAKQYFSYFLVSKTFFLCTACCRNKGGYPRTGKYSERTAGAFRWKPPQLL